MTMYKIAKGRYVGNSVMARSLISVILVLCRAITTNF